MATDKICEYLYIYNIYIIFIYIYRLDACKVYIYIRAIEKTTPVAYIYKSKWIDKLIYIYTFGFRRFCQILKVIYV